MEDNRIWGSYTSKEAEEFIKKDPVIILPVGSYEQHGPHLTLNTDSTIIEEIVKRAIKSSNVPCSYLPTIYTGISEHHMQYPGSITIKQSTLRELTCDIIYSLHRHGIRKVIILNGHGGNTSLLTSAINDLGSELPGEYIFAGYWSLVNNIINEITQTKPGTMDHAGELETALKMYLTPEDVRNDLITPGITLGNDYWKPEFMSNRITKYMPFHKFTKFGHIGDPTKSTVEMGKRAFELIVTEVVELIDLLYENGFKFKI